MGKKFEFQKNPIDNNTRFVGKNHPSTSKAMEEKALPKSGSFRRQLYETVVKRGDVGATDYEMEDAFNRSHQSVSGAMSKLRSDGWLVDSGKIRKNKYGNDCKVWTAVPER